MKTLILLTGLKRSGKDTVADMMLEVLGRDNVFTTAFAEPLKEMVANDFNILEERLGDLANILKGVDATSGPLQGVITELEIDLTNFESKLSTIPRLLWQIYGTNIFRDRVNHDYWVDLCINKCKSESKEFSIITDVRFPNEIINDDWFDNIVTVRIQRDLCDDTDGHASETAMRGIDTDYIIENNASLNKLFSNVENVIDNIVSGNEIIDSDPRSNTVLS